MQIQKNVHKFQEHTLFFTKTFYLKHDSSIYYNNSLLFFFSRKVIFSTHQFCQIGVICNFLPLDQYSYKMNTIGRFFHHIVWCYNKIETERDTRGVSRGHMTEREFQGSIKLVHDRRENQGPLSWYIQEKNNKSVPFYHVHVQKPCRGVNSVHE